ncbi:MAG: isoprenoid biosynthesis glyoxalase ElbB [Phycisphaerales bacterium]|nr:isoprenoid biosynthesis glyoxalase ElbB [Phycisphaerales bacterium]
MTKPKANVAVVLSGCGVYDGSEIHEAVSVLRHISQAGAHYECFAPDIEAESVNHATGKHAEKRRVLAEAARIARGKIHPLAQLKANDYDAVFFPGGFGAAKNLCNFAQMGAECQVEPEVERTIKEFNQAGKPIGACCIAPVLLAKVLGKASGGPGCTLTIGDDENTAGAIKAMGAMHVDTPVTRAFVDDGARVVTSPAYMYGEAKIHEVDQGIGEMVQQTLALASSHPVGAH